MDIVVLCGGLSPERNVSLSSGTKIASALMELGHRVVLCDMFLRPGVTTPESWTVSSPTRPALGGTRIEGAPDLEAVRAARKPQVGLHVRRQGPLRSAAWPISSLWPLHGALRRDGRVQAAFDLLGINPHRQRPPRQRHRHGYDLTKRVVAPSES